VGGLVGGLGPLEDAGGRDDGGRDDGGGCEGFGAAFLDADGDSVAFFETVFFFFPKPNFPNKLFFFFSFSNVDPNIVGSLILINLFLLGGAFDRPAGGNGAFGAGGLFGGGGAPLGGSGFVPLFDIFLDGALPTFPGCGGGLLPGGGGLLPRGGGLLPGGDGLLPGGGGAPRGGSGFGFIAAEDLSFFDFFFFSFLSFLDFFFGDVLDGGSGGRPPGGGGFPGGGFPGGGLPGGGFPGGGGLLFGGFPG